MLSSTILKDKKQWFSGKKNHNNTEWEYVKHCFIQHELYFCLSIGKKTNITLHSLKYKYYTKTLLYIKSGSNMKTNKYAKKWSSIK